MNDRTKPHKPRIAYHEAGHAVAMWSYRIPIQTVSIISGEGFDGRAMTVGDPTMRRYQAIVILLAGGVAEIMYDPDTNPEGAAADFDEALRLVIAIDPAADQVLDMFMDYARDILMKHRPALDAVAAALLAEETLSGRKVRAICNRTSTTKE